MLPFQHFWRFPALQHLPQKISLGSALSGVSGCKCLSRVQVVHYELYPCTLQALLYYYCMAELRSNLGNVTLIEYAGTRSPHL